MSEGGISFQNEIFSFQLRNFIGDAPARAFIMNHYAHMSKNPCSKCKVTGTYSQNRMCFLGINHAPRTDNEYKNRTDLNHHKSGISALTKLSINEVSNVPFDYMHLVLLGVMKRLFDAWITGKFPGFVKLDDQSQHILDSRLKSLDQWCPVEFARRPGSIFRYIHYKATELRHFLLYAGPCVLHGVIPENYYTHFLLLHVAIRILVSPVIHNEQLTFAENALKSFVILAETLYGKSFLSYNSHGLLHLVDDVRKFGPLDLFSAFTYENNMPILENLIHSHNRPLQQFTLRSEERKRNNFKQNRRPVNVLKAWGDHEKGPIPSNLQSNELVQFSKTKQNSLTLSNDQPNNCCVLTDGSVCIINNKLLYQNSYYLVVQAYNQKEVAYDCGINLENVCYYVCSDLSTNLKTISIHEVKQKGYRKPYFNNTSLHDTCYISILLHTEIL